LFDRIGGGTIRTRDLAFVMRSIGYETTPIELEQMIRQVDQDGSRTTKSRAIGPVEHLLV
jgi:Ca2+-binding EF-hand superfamily protein